MAGIGLPSLSVLLLFVALGCLLLIILHVSPDVLILLSLNHDVFLLLLRVLLQECQLCVQVFILVLQDLNVVLSGTKIVLEASLCRLLLLLVGLALL